MSWLDRLRDASFRNVPFLVDDARNSGGRRPVVYQYPLRDKSSTDDLGRNALGTTFDAYVIGADYMSARDKLIDALQQYGPGELVHPYLGELTVQIGTVEWSESAREGGLCSFSIQCFESSAERYPRAVLYTPDLAAAAVDAAELAVASAFGLEFNVADAPDFVAADAIALVDSAAEQIRGVVSRFTTLPSALTTFTDSLDRLSSAAANLVLVPLDLAGQVQGIIGQLVVAAERPRAAIDALQLLFGFGAELAPITATTPSRQQQAGNQAALVNLVRQLATLEACRASSQVDFESYDDARAVRDLLIEQADAICEADIDDAAYQALTSARSAMSRDIGARGADLARLIKINLPTSLPALVLAWDLYGDAARADEIVLRNRLANPLFLPSGVDLEALDS